MAKDHEAALKKLNTATGPAFDRAFLEHEVAYHKAVLDAVTTTLLPALQNQEVKDLVNKIAPAFQAHMLAAQNLLDKEAKVSKQ
jgi:putative membrane protein